MFSVKALILLFSSVGSFAAPTGSGSLTSDPMAKSIMRRSTANSQGMNNGYFYSMWSDGTGDVEYNNGADGQYSLTWSNAGDVVVGKGFQTGSPRTITYNADYEPNGISFLSIYGWFTDPLTEYYICENWGTGNPSGGDGMILKGHLESDGSTYDVYEHQQTDAPSIQGVTNFKQYWSIRQDRRTAGTINTANHYNYWKSIGLPIGTFGYQILATEGVKSSGKSSVTISEGGSGSADGSNAVSAAEGAPSSAAAISTASASIPSTPPATSAVAPPQSPEVPVPNSQPASSSVTAASVASSVVSSAPPASTAVASHPESPEVAVTTVVVTEVVTTVETVAARP